MDGEWIVKEENVRQHRWRMQCIKAKLVDVSVVIIIFQIMVKFISLCHRDENFSKKIKYCQLKYSTEACLYLQIAVKPSMTPQLGVILGPRLILTRRGLVSFDSSKQFFGYENPRNIPTHPTQVRHIFDAFLTRNQKRTNWFKDGFVTG